MNCEECGMELTAENTYLRAIGGAKHYFCCSHCADASQKKLGRAAG